RALARFDSNHGVRSPGAGASKPCGGVATAGDADLSELRRVRPTRRRAWSGDADRSVLWRAIRAGTNRQRRRSAPVLPARARFAAAERDGRAVAGRGVRWLPRPSCAPGAEWRAQFGICIGLAGAIDLDRSALRSCGPRHADVGAVDAGG